MRYVTLTRTTCRCSALFLKSECNMLYASGARTLCRSMAATRRAIDIIDALPARRDICLRAHARARRYALLKALLDLLIAAAAAMRCRCCLRHADDMPHAFTRLMLTPISPMMPPRRLLRCFDAFHAAFDAFFAMLPPCRGAPPFYVFPLR